VDQGDLLCSVCGRDLDENIELTARAENPDVTRIDGWCLGKRLSKNSQVRERYLAVNEDDGRQGVLTLYHAGSEPDIAVYDVLRSLPRDHVPEIMAIGRWQGRAYEVDEELTGGTLADIGLLPNDPQTLARIVKEIGRALHSFSEVGLRHRDLRPGAILVRARDPLDLVVTSFGSARLSDFDLDIVSPLETTRYSAPEAIAGGVAAASDWWSLGMILLEQITRGSCFAGINDQAFLIHVLTNGVPIPDEIDPRFALLLRGLLARNRRERWSLREVQQWLEGGTPPVPGSATEGQPSPLQGPAISLAGQPYTSPTAFALGAADVTRWAEAKDKLIRGELTGWAAEAGLAEKILARLRQLTLLDNVSDDFRLSLALKILNPDIPLTCRGEIVTPSWLLNHPDEGYELITGPVPDLLKDLEAELWLSRLKNRAAQIRERAQQLEVQLNEEEFRVHLLSTSQSRLAAVWETRRRVLPDTAHPALAAILERRQTSEEDLILLLSAAVGHFQTVDTIVNEAAKLAAMVGLTSFDSAEAAKQLLKSRREIYAVLDKRIGGFARCGIPRIDEWIDQFRLERRIATERILVALSLPPNRWQALPQQTQVATLLDFFAKRVASAVQRGPLSRMTIGKATPRIDVAELGSERTSAAALLNHLLLRSDLMIDVDPLVFHESDLLERRIRSLHSRATLYRRDTGIDGLYLGFPFLVIPQGKGARPRIAPVLLWPISLKPQVGARSSITIGFNRNREEVRLNPAFDTILGPDATKRWQELAWDLLGRASLTAADVVDAFGTLAAVQGRTLIPLPDNVARARENQLICAAVLFNLVYLGQAVVEDLRQLKSIPPTATGLATALRISESPDNYVPDAVKEIDRYFTVASDPSQEAAVFDARRAPGLVVEGPPGTGKSQTIVNMVCDAIGRQQSLLIVCQKQAALDVVYKRLEAKGLADRIIKITDVTQDREPLIRSIREQLEEMSPRAYLTPEVWRQSRPQLAGRIEALESELDHHHAALHTVDTISGLTYREILGDLIRLEQESPPLIGAPNLRQLLAKQSMSDIAMLEEVCGPLAHYWLPSHFEDSPLVALKIFSTDPATITAFQKDLEEFTKRETARDAVFEKPLQALPADPRRISDWLQSHARAFQRLATDQRRRLKQWVSLFIRKDEKSNVQGNSIIAELEALRTELENFLSAPQSTLQTLLVAIETQELTRWLTLAEEMAIPVSFFAKLSLNRWSKSKQLKAFFQTHAMGEVSTQLAPFINAAKYELELRPMRLRLLSIVTRLRPADAQKFAEGSAQTLIKLAVDLIDQLTEVRDLASRLCSCSQAGIVLTLLDPVRIGDFDTFTSDTLQAADHYEACVRVNETLERERAAARQQSHEAIVQLDSWFTETWLETRKIAIDRGISNEKSLVQIAHALPHLSDYQRFRLRASNLSAEGMAVFRILRQIESTLVTLPREDLDPIVRRTIAHEARIAWKTRLEGTNPALHLETIELNAKAQSLATMDEQMRQANRQLLINGIDTSRLSPLPAWEDITRLRGQRARRLREFIDRGADLGLMALRPVWLMNPDVVSRVLPLKPGFFDTVIFDEASQIPVEYALPSLYRSKIIVVSGDEKQMPPTAFFSSRVENDDADLLEGDEAEEEFSPGDREVAAETWNRREIKDCPDLLQLAKMVLRTTTLQIHYRSVYRELISFSNASFYANRLSVPARHPDDEVRRIKPIEVIQTKGIYQDQTNQTEAEIISEILRDLWAGPSSSRKSIGVVTFNRKQADLIEEILEAQAEQDTVFRDALTQERERIEQGEDMGFFVKNVENVQGDERDIIIFSATFGRNSQGTFRRSFGVLGQAGGERRLNVAITRAREKVYLITSMPIGEISDLLSTRRRATSPRDYLQAYLEYGRALSAGELDTSRSLLSRFTTERPTFARNGEGNLDGFQIAVAEFIKSLGFQPVRVSDDGAFSFDFAIADPRTGLYGIGIECDAPRHSLLSRARARDVWRPSVLARSIPQIHRVSSQGWYHNLQNEQLCLRQAILRALE
jgi:hypothetical protein